MVRTSHIISACFGALFCAAIVQPWATQTSVDAPTSSLELVASANEPLPPTQGEPVTKTREAAAPDSPPYPVAPNVFTEEMARNCLEIAHMIDPDMADRLEHLHQTDPAKFRVLLASGGRRLLSLAELRSRDPKLFSIKMQEMKTDMRVMEVGRDLRKAVERADETAIAALEAELSSLLHTQFAFTVASRAEYIMRLEKHVDQLKQEIDEMVTNMERLISQRLEEIKCGETPVQPSWQRFSTFDYSGRFHPSLEVGPHPQSNPTKDDADDRQPDE